jgi:hypothetical protein
MQINKKIECNYCHVIVEESGKCNCGKIVLFENNLVSIATPNVDYKDLTPKLLNE